MALTDPTINISTPASADAQHASEKPAAFYLTELSESNQLLKELQKQIRLVATGRLITGIAIILCIYRLFRTFGAAAWWLALIILLITFILLLRRSGDLQQKETFESNRKRFNEQELEGLKGRFEAFDGGAGMVGSDHPFAFDLDLFGSRSLFQRINRTVTVGGKNTLAAYLASPEQDSTLIRGRQSMVKAIQDLPKWCQQFLITGSLNQEDKQDQENIETWLEMPPVYYPSKQWKLLITVLPVFTLLAWLLYIFGPIPAWPAIGLSLILLGITGRQSKVINESHQLISKRADTLKKYHELVALFMNQPFEQPALETLKEKLHLQQQGTGGFKKFIRLIAALDNRLNFLMNIILNGLLLWDLNCLYRIEQWKQIFKGQFGEWIKISSELDALISLSIFNFNHPDYVRPEIVDRSPGNEQEFTLDITSGRHPLLFPEASIANSLHQGALLNLYLITGANMAGKSTFLRMVGLNMVLAMAGANVAAEAMRLTPVALYTSMRTNDSLFTHTSFFYAELKKLRWIMDQIKSGKSIYIMLDEILKGTNSRDQHLGSAALIKNIIQNNGRGLIATHDIELTNLAASYPDHIKNIAFEIDMQGDKMIFSYQYRDGVCQNMNASTLMKQMGII
ncbi:MutS domain V [Arachidicoccus rhizosphaerae]|uniref:MutS domain V n=1 Tax=Arachidicoccus rhizosphaerae TaxID=551991 RepID=A0A1H3WNQ1_9BACT|nr:hypothetical protein [Arachidicoccus rhizosphaerae]SDZ88759.1 MutS domain V [Arachidicoccus rhizosphaerae]